MDIEIFSDKVYELIDSASPLVKLDTGFTFTEGPVWHDGVYYFTDFMVNKIFRYENGKSVLINGDSHFSIGMTYDRRKKRILRCARDIRAITDLDGNIICNKWNGIPINGSNDVIVDSAGRIFFSDPLSRTDLTDPQIGHPSFFMYNEERGEMTMIEKDLPRPNGLALSPDEKILYLIDTTLLAIFELDLATMKRKKEPLVTFDKSFGDGLPDGMRLDANGNIYTSGPGGIWIVSPSGEKLGLIKMPEVAANLCFDDRGLFITASTSIYRVDTKAVSAV
jgi:gluconolactonase